MAIAGEWNGRLSMQTWGTFKLLLDWDYINIGGIKQ